MESFNQSHRKNATIHVNLISLKRIIESRHITGNHNIILYLSVKSCITSNQFPELFVYIFILVEISLTGLAITCRWGFHCQFYRFFYILNVDCSL